MSAIAWPSLVLVSLLLTGCGSGPFPGPTAQPPRSRPGLPVNLHPECDDATEQGPLVALGCKLGCVPRSRPQTVCVDDPPELLGLLPGEPVPAIAAVWDSTGACAGFRLYTLNRCKVFNDVLLPWAKHPPTHPQYVPGERCARANDLVPDNGYFTRPPDPGHPLNGGGGRQFCFFEEFFPNE